MADNVPITAGSGTNISTEEVTTLNGSGSQPAQHVQRVMLATVAATAATDVSASNKLPVDPGIVSVRGSGPHGDVDGSYPVILGAQAIAHGTNPTAVDAADATRLYANLHGILFTIGGHPNTISYAHSAITTAVTDTALVSVSAGTKIVVTGLTVTLDDASTVRPTVRIGFGTANVPALGNAGVLLAHGGVPSGGGVNRGDGSGILGIGADGEDLRITTTGNATGNGLQVVVTYYTVGG